MATMRVVLGVGALSMSLAVEPNPPIWPDSVKVYSSDTNISTIQADLDDAWLKTGGQVPEGEPRGRYGPGRYAFLFKPGTYEVDAPMGYYMHIAGIGQSPDDVVFAGGTGPHVPCENKLPQPGQLVTFWRTAEHFKRVGDMDWLVSQAAPLRDIHVEGDLYLNRNKAHASGGYLGNSKVSGQVVAGGQQQWFTRNSEIGSWSGVGWSAVFVGVQDESASNELTQNTCGDAGNFKPQTVVVDKTPAVCEKPFISVDPSDDTKFNLNVPQMRVDSVGPDWSTGTVIGFEDVYVTKLTDTAADINDKLAQGLHVVVAPGIYSLEAPLELNSNGQVLLCLGLSTLLSTVGNEVVKVGAGVTDVHIAGCLLEAGQEETPTLLQWGEKNSTGANGGSGTLHDVFTRVGGPGFNGTNGGTAQAHVQITIDSDDVIGDHLWLWRGDHFDNATEMTDATAPADIGMTLLGDLPNENCMVVNGDRVRIYHLAVEHAQEDQLVWSGEEGEVYFFQCEIPYEVDQVWADGNFVSYRVTENVSTHRAYGVGTYSFFRDYDVFMGNGFSVPESVLPTMVQPFVVKLAGQGGITHTINDLGPGVGLNDEIHQVTFYNNECTPREAMTTTTTNLPQAGNMTNMTMTMTTTTTILPQDANMTTTTQATTTTLNAAGGSGSNVGLGLILGIAGIVLVLIAIGAFLFIRGQQGQTRQETEMRAGMNNPSVVV